MLSDTTEIPVCPSFTGVNSPAMQLWLIMVSSQADFATRLSITLLGSGRDWHHLYLPEYIRIGRGLVYKGRRKASPDETIRWYKECGIHGIHD
ncbi:hypothetical protein JK231_21710 [Pantoea sp. JGM49]|uniref:hypothetical protein n=1 Tax=Pantoea sp. JGM49 TaxID=2799791 RepID=UPI001BA4A1B9|nr:hypothetical protein [Pantoea sp. JGM49]MBS0883212.1 hypothetical protein [Pantoea sp. JGM49]